MKAYISYADGQYYLEEVRESENGDRVFVLDDRDWERWQEYRNMMRGWNDFLRDLESRAGGYPAYGPSPKG